MLPVIVGKNSCDTINHNLINSTMQAAGIIMRELFEF